MPSIIEERKKKIQENKKIDKIESQLGVAGRRKAGTSVAVQNQVKQYQEKAAKDYIARNNPYMRSRLNDWRYVKNDSGTGVAGYRELMNRRSEYAKALDATNPLDRQRQRELSDAISAIERNLYRGWKADYAQYLSDLEYKNAAPERAKQALEDARRAPNTVTAGTAHRAMPVMQERIRNAEEAYYAAISERLKGITDINVLMRERDRYAKELDSANPLDKTAQNDLTIAVKAYDERIAEWRKNESERQRVVGRAVEESLPDVQNVAAAQFGLPTPRQQQEANRRSEDAENPRIAYLLHSMQLDETRQHEYFDQLKTELATEPFEDVGSVRRHPDAKYLQPQDEKVYNYLLLHVGEEIANAFLDYKEESINLNRGRKTAERIEKYSLSDEQAALNRIRYGATSAFDFSGIEAVARNSFGGMLEDKPTSAHEYATQEVRQDLGRDGKIRLPAELGGGTLSQAAFDAVNTTAHMVPAIVVSAVTQQPIAGALMMGVDAGGKAYQQARKEGFTKRQAEDYGTIIGLLEGGLEYAIGGIGKLGGKLTNGAVKRLVKNLNNAALRIAVEGGMNAAGEGFEEYLQEILDPIVRNIALGEKNAFAIYTPEALYAAILGALTGFASGSVEAVPNAFVTANGKSVSKTGNSDELIERALSLPAESEAYKLAELMKNGSEEKTDFNLGTLLYAFVQDGGNTEFLNINRTAQVGVNSADSTASPADMAQVDELQSKDANLADSAVIKRSKGQPVGGFATTIDENGVEQQTFIDALLNSYFTCNFFSCFFDSFFFNFV